MNYKKTFFNLMAVAMATTLCIGITSCNKDDKPEDIDKRHLLMLYKWVNITNDSGNFDSRYGIEFKKDGTYTYGTLNESVAGNYQIFKIQKFTGVLSFTGIAAFLGVENESEFDGTLYKMNVIGSSNFDQLWVYHSNSGSYIIVHFYLNEELVYKPAFAKYIE